MINKFVLKIFDGFFLNRILLLIPVWTVLILGWITGSEKAGIGGELRGFSGGGASLWLALFLFSLIVSFIYIVNQIADVESDRLNNKLFILPHGHISIRSAWIMAVLNTSIGLAGAWYFFDVTMFVIFIAGFFVGILYNLPPAKLKDHAIGGAVANLVGHGVITYLVGWYAAKSDVAIDRSFLLHALFVSLSAGFANAAVYLTTTIPDAEGDRKVGKKTFAVLFGEKNTAIVAALSCGLALLFSLFLDFNAWVMVVPSFLSFILFLRFVFVNDRAKAFQTFRWPVIVLSVSVSIFVPLYAVLVIFIIFITKIYYKKRFNYNYPNFSGE